MSQRQSGVYCNKTQTGLPRAPARWTMQELTEITRSRQERSAAASEKPLSAAAFDFHCPFAGLPRALLPAASHELAQRPFDLEDHARGASRKKRKRQNWIVSP